MKSQRKKRLLIGAATIIVAAVAVGMLYHPPRDVVFEVSGTESSADAVFLVDGEEQTKQLILPASLSFRSSRELQWSLRKPSDGDEQQKTTWHVRVSTDPASNAELDYELDSIDDGTSGFFKCPNLLGYFDCWASGDPKSVTIQK